MTNNNGGDPNGIYATGAAVNPVDGSLWSWVVNTVNQSNCLLRVDDEIEDVYCPNFPAHATARSKLLIDEFGMMYMGLAIISEEPVEISLVASVDLRNPYTVAWSFNGSMRTSFPSPWLIGFVNSTTAQRYLIWAGLEGDVQVPLKPNNLVPDFAQNVTYLSGDFNGQGLSNLLYSPDGRYVYNNAQFHKPGCTSRFSLPLVAKGQQHMCYPQNFYPARTRWQIAIDTRLTVFVTNSYRTRTVAIHANGTTKWNSSWSFGYIAMTDDEELLIGGDTSESQGYEPDHQMSALNATTGALLWHKQVNEIWDDVTACYNNKAASADVMPKLIPGGPGAPNGLGIAFCDVKPSGRAVRFFDVRTGIALNGSIATNPASMTFFVADIAWNFWVFAYNTNTTSVRKYQLGEIIN